MYIVVIGWLYVALMMAVAEATNTTGTVLGAIVTFVLYGLAPMALVLYLLGTPARRRALKAQELAAQDAARRNAVPGDAAGPSGVQPDTRGETATEPVAPVRKET